MNVIEEAKVADRIMHDHLSPEEERKVVLASNHICNRAFWNGVLLGVIIAVATVLAVAIIVLGG